MSVFSFLTILAIVWFNPQQVLGPIKPMNAANNGPIESNMETYSALHIPYARSHDSALGEAYGRHCVDISEIFPDWSASVNSPKSYDFALTDEYIANIIKAGSRPFFRLGQSIEHQSKKYEIYPPRSYRKWAKICEHIIRHYNEGWAEGFHYGIEYWEIWNEADLDWSDGRWQRDPRTWTGTPEQFYELYDVAAKHLKGCFPNLKIGGPALANPYLYAEPFLDHVKASGAPLDFFSWHMYHFDPKRMSRFADRYRKALDARGFEKTESILNEWNYVKSWDETNSESARIRPTAKAAAFVAATMCECQKASPDMLMYYDLRPDKSWNGAFAPYTMDVLPPYYSLLYWAQLSEYGTSIASLSPEQDDIYSCAALKGDRVRLLVARYNDDDLAVPTPLDLDIPEGYSLESCRITDADGSDRNAAISERIVLAPNAVALLEFRKN